MPEPKPAAAFAIRVNSIDDLFDGFHAGPLSARPLAREVRGYLLDEWERVRAARPSTLTVFAPESERANTDEQAARAALRQSLRAYSGPLRRAGALSRRERVGLTIGVAFFLACIAASTLLDRLSSDVVLIGISQGLVLVGWVALWAPADRLVTEIFPHFVNRRRYKEFAGIDVRFVWT